MINFLRIYVAKIGKYGDWNGVKWCSKTKKQLLESESIDIRMQ